MFVRAKKSGRYQYLQLVYNRRVNGKVRQFLVGKLGRLDVLQNSGEIDALMSSCAKFARQTALIEAHRRGKTQPAKAVSVGPALVFEKLWEELQLPRIIEDLLAERKLNFRVERAVFLTVLHRLFESGSDRRAAEVWREGVAIRDAEELKLHHLYRAMFWLGETLSACPRLGVGGDAQAGLGHQPRQVGARLRCTKDLIEEELFNRRRGLFSSLELVFLDTSSIYFEGEGGESIGQYGNSKDHRPDCKQMVVGVALDDKGRPICSETWPGNTSDAKALLPVTDRLRERFGIRKMCVVADRGMISRETIKGLQQAGRNVNFILGARMRAVREIREDVLGDDAPYKKVYGPRRCKKDRSPLCVKDVVVEGRRYVVCYNEEQAAKDRADRAAIVSSLQKQLKLGDKALIGNKGYRKFLKAQGQRFEIDRQKVGSESRFDGIWVLQTDMDIEASEVALRYKELWQVESAFRSLKSVLRTRPVYHKRNETIRGHVFCSFLALVLLKELQLRMAERGGEAEWERLKHDIIAMQEVYIKNAGRTFVIRTETLGDAGKAVQAVGASLGSVVRLCPDDAETLPG